MASDFENVDLLSQGRQPFLVVATSGTTVLGAFDPLNDIADVCEKHKLWLHVDCCWGGSVKLSRTHQHLMNGIERCVAISLCTLKRCFCIFFFFFFLQVRLVGVEPPQDDGVAAAVLCLPHQTRGTHITFAVGYSLEYIATIILAYRTCCKSVTVPTPRTCSNKTRTMTSVTTRATRVCSADARCDIRVLLLN